MTWSQIINRFGRGSARICARLKEIFNYSSTDRPDTYRIAELWTYEATSVKGGTHFEMAWKCRFFSPDGTVIHISDSKFPHKSHPFVVKFYPLIDGEVHSFIEDLVERQQSINRLLTTFEATMASSAKGALLFPMDQLVKGYTYDDIGILWGRPDSVIPITGRGNMLPQQLVVNNAASGIVPLIEMQLKLFEESSGVGEALMGRSVSPTIGAELYKTIMENADVGIVDLFRSFRSFLDSRNKKAASTLINPKD